MADSTIYGIPQIISFNWYTILCVVLESVGTVLQNMWFS